MSLKHSGHDSRRHYQANIPTADHCQRGRASRSAFATEEQRDVVMCSCSPVPTDIDTLVHHVRWMLELFELILLRNWTWQGGSIDMPAVDGVGSDGVTTVTTRPHCEALPEPQ